MAENFSDLDPNDASSDKWLLVMSTGLKLLGRKVNSFDLPGINADGTIGPKGGGNTLMQVPSDTIIFDPIVFTFIVDETYENYIAAVKQVLMAVTSGEFRDVFFDVDIVPLNNRRKDINLTFKYMNARATNISTVSYDTNADVRTLTCTMTIMFEDFKIMRGEEILVSTLKSDNLE